MLVILEMRKRGILVISSVEGKVGIAKAFWLEGGAGRMVTW